MPPLPSFPRPKIQGPRIPISYNAIIGTAIKSMVKSVASGVTIAEMIKENIGRKAWLAMLVFIWISLVYVIVAFADMTAGTFVGRIEELQGMQVGFERASH